MSGYLEYNKCGEILIAPSLECKHKYLLKCDLCEKLFAKMQLFFTHYLSHYELESDEEADDGNLMEFDHQEDDRNMIECDEEVQDNVITEKDDNDNDDSCETINQIDPCEDNLIQEPQKQMSPVEDIEWKYNMVKVRNEEQSMESPDTDDTHIEVIKSEELENIENSPLEECESNEEQNQDDDITSHMNFVKQFMKSKENVTELIAEYKRESHLWDFSQPVQNRKMKKRTMTWSQIALNLRITRNVDINGSQVAACIVYLRQSYRENKKRAIDKTENDNEILPMWVFKLLMFLDRFVEGKPIGILDIHQDLAPKQTLQILDIFQRCPNLWDSNTFEYYCTNMRNVSLNKMKSIISEEMDLEVDTNKLEKYISSITEYFSLEKRRQRAAPKEFIAPKYYDQLQFLQNHVGPFQCSHCRHNSYTRLRLKQHESKHTKTMPFKCPECQKEYNNVETYIYHMKRHMGDLNHQCKLCGKMFIRDIEVRDHMRSHTGDKPFRCDICSASFSHRTGFGRHMKIHLKKYISFCPYCSKGFYTKDSMMKHAVVHTNVRDFVCSICGKAFKTKRTLRSHVAIHENGNYACDICGKSSFKNKINLWQHKRKHKINDEKRKKKLL